jgi:hypothetical protein
MEVVGLANEDIRLEAKHRRIHLWEIAVQMKISESWFFKKLRQELSAGEKVQVRQAIQELVAKGD